MKIAHTSNYAPGLSGMYNSVRDLVLEERRLGNEAEVIDDSNSFITPGTDGIFPVSSAYGDKADIICWHHAIAESWLNEPHRNLILFLHGTPEFNFFTEMHETDKVFSLLVGAANAKIPKAFVTMWKRHVPYWENFLNTKVHYVPAWANMDEWKVSTLTPDPKVLRIAMVDFWRLTREPFGIIAALEQLRKNTKKKIQVNVWGITDTPNDLYKAIIQWLVEKDIMVLRGNTRDPMNDIYHKNDLVVSMSTEETRVVREAYSCGVPVVCARGPLHFTKYSTDGIDSEALAKMIDKCHNDLVKGKDKFRKQLRDYAENNFDVRKSVAALMPIFNEVIEKHGSTNIPKFSGKVRPVCGVAETCDKLKARFSKREATCFLRFGDGDLILMNGQENESLHDNSPELQKELTEAFTHNEEGYFVSSVAGQINEGRMQKGLFAAPEYSEQLLEIVNRFRPDETLDNANALGYMSVFEPDWFVDFLRASVHGRKVLFVGGKDLCTSGLVRRVFNVQTFFPLPMSNAYYEIQNRVDEIKELTKTHDMIICAAGMATRVLAKRLWTQGFRTDFIDIGSIADALAGITSRSWMRMISGDYISNYANAFMPAKTDIVVLSYGQEDKTIRCFESIAKNTENYRVIWVDNGSSKESIEKVKPAAAKLMECDLISVPQNEGFSKGVNRALRKIIGEGNAPYVALLNNDVVVSPGWLYGLVSAQVSAGFDAIGPLTSENNPQAVDAFREVIPTLPKFTDEDDINTRADKLRSLYGSQTMAVGDMLSFFCCLLRRETIEQVGLLDEAMFAYGEDNDYFKRLKVTGKKCGLALGVYVHHDHSVTSNTMGDGWKEKMQRDALKYLEKKWGNASKKYIMPQLSDKR